MVAVMRRLLAGFWHVRSSESFDSIQLFDISGLELTRETRTVA